MTIEEMFIKEYQELKEKNQELVNKTISNEMEYEKALKLLKIEIKQKDELLSSLVEFLQKGKPRLTDSNGLYLDSYYLVGKEKDKVLKMFKDLKVKVEGGQNESN